jgi:DNA-binding response OmpR family regulator
MSKRRILIVDDEKGFTSMLSLNLEVTGRYDVKVVNDSSNVINEALDFRPELILLDVIMPKLEGPDIAMELKNHASLKTIPVVFLTATVTVDEVYSQGGKIGGHSFVAKPSNLSVLIDSIEKAIGPR